MSSAQREIFTLGKGTTSPEQTVQTSSDITSDQGPNCLSLTLRKTPIQIYIKKSPPRTEKFQIKYSDIFHISVQNINCGYSFVPPGRGDSNEYPQSMFSSRNKKNNAYPSKPQFYYIYKSGLSVGQNYIGMFS